MADDTTTAQTGSKVFQLLAEQVQEFIKTPIDEEGVRRIADERIAQAKLPRPIEVRMGDTVLGKVEERTHAQFDELLSVVNEGHSNILMVGPAGTGKTTLAKHLAKALGRDFGFLSLSAGVSETHIFGRTLPQADGSWQYKASGFVEVYSTFR